MLEISRYLSFVYRLIKETKSDEKISKSSNDMGLFPRLISLLVKKKVIETDEQHCILHIKPSQQTEINKKTWYKPRRSHDGKEKNSKDEKQDKTWYKPRRSHDGKEKNTKDEDLGKLDRCPGIDIFHQEKRERTVSTDNHQTYKCEKYKGVTTRFYCSFKLWMISWMFLAINLTFIPLSSGFPVGDDIVWEQSTTPATIGKNVTLICFVRANSGEYFGWYRQPSMETLAHQNISSNKAKYHVSVEFVDPFYEYKLTILEVEFNDLNRIYICSNFDKEYQNVLKMTENTFIFKPQIQDVKKRIWMDNGKMKAEIIIPHVYPEPTCVLESKDNQIQPVRMSRQNISTDIFEIRYSFDVLPCVGNVSMMCTIHDELVLQDVIAFNMTDCNTGEEKEQGLVIVISVVITVVCVCLLVTVIIVICRRKKEGKCVCAKRNRSYRLPKNRPCENGNAIDNEGGENPGCTSSMILQKISC